MAAMATAGSVPDIGSVGGEMQLKFGLDPG
jgi:hypothetical protein